AYSVIGLRCFPGWRSPRMFQLLTTGSKQARECGTRHTIISSGQSISTRDWPTPEGGRRPYTNLGSSLGLYPRPAPTAALPQAESPLYWSIQNPEADQQCDISASAPTQTPPELKLKPLLLKFWTNHLSTLSMKSWIYSAEGAAWNISSTVRGMDLRNDPGFPERTYSTLPFCWNSIAATRIALPLAGIGNRPWRRG
ncbi:hypothetical protein M9458_002964, partial [Cirrhinus mrigala]